MSIRIYTPDGKRWRRPMGFDPGELIQDDPNPREAISGNMIQGERTGQWRRCGGGEWETWKQEPYMEDEIDG